MIVLAVSRSAQWETSGMIEGLAACFTGLEDPRETRRCDHQLIDILVIAVGAVIACAESWEDIELYGRCKRDWLQRFPLHSLLTVLLLIPASPIACTRSSTRRVETPPTQASWITATSAFSAVLRGSRNGGKYEPCRSLGMRKLRGPSRVSKVRSRYPLR